MQRFARVFCAALVGLSLLVVGCDEFLPDGVAPGEVVGLSAIAGDGEIELTWTNPGDPDFESCIIWFGTQGETDRFGTITVGSAATIDGLQNGSSYTFLVKTSDKSGNTSAGTTVIAAPANLNPPYEVSGLFAVPGDGQVTLVWTAPADSDLDFYELWYGTGGVADTEFTGTVDSTATTIVGLDSGTEYTFVLKTVDTAGNISDGVTLAAVPVDPEAPDEVTDLVGVPGFGVVDLTWTASASVDVEGYVVYVKEGAGSYDAGTDVGDVTAYQVTGLTTGANYTFKVTVYDEMPNESAGAETAQLVPLLADSWDLKFNGYGIDSAMDVAVDPNDNSVYVVGYGQDLVGVTGYDWWIKKFDAAGQEDTTSWNLQFDGNGGNDVAQGVAISPDGSVYVVGYGSNLVDVATGVDWWIKKYDSSGTELWEKTCDNEGVSDYAYDVVVNIEGGGLEHVYVVGSADYSAVPGYPDWWIKKYSADGTEDTVNWNKLIALNSYDTAYRVAVTAAYVYVAGNSSGNWFLAKFNASTGARDTANWDFNVDTGGQGVPYGLAVGTDGSVYVAGWMLSGERYWSMRKYSSAGVEDTTTWPLSFGGAVAGHDYPSSMAITTADELYVAGYGNNLTGSGDNDWWIKKVDSAGTEDAVNWDKMIGSGNGGESAQGVAVTPDGSSVYVVGNGANLLGATDADWWIKKFDADGTEK